MTYPIKNYVSITKAYHPSFSYDGRILVFISDTAGIPQIYEMPLTADLSRPTWRNQITRGDMRVLGCWFSPAFGDERLLFSVDANGDGNVQFRMIDPAESGLVHLTAGFETSRHVLGDWSTDGSQIIFAANRRDPALFDLYIQPLDGLARIIWRNEEPGLLQPISFSPDADRAIVVRMKSLFEHELFEIDIEQGLISQLSPSGESIRFTRAQFSKDGQWVYLNTDLESDFLYIARLNLTTLDFESIAEADQDIENMTLSPDGKHLAYTINVDGASSLKVMDLSSDEVRTAPLPDDVPGVVAKWDSRLTFSPYSRHIAFSYTTPIRTADIHIWNLEMDQIYHITRSSHSNIPKATFQIPQLVQYTSFDQREIPAFFYEPQREDDEAGPAVIYLRGGPASQHTFSFDFLAQYFISHGIAVLAPNVRGSIGYGKGYRQLDDRERRMDSIADLAQAAEWLKHQPRIDGSRLALYGDSFSGFMVLAAMTTYPEQWVAGVANPGIANFVTFLQNTRAYHRAFYEAEYGSLTNDWEFLERISPIHHLDKMTAPLMVVHGVHNPYIPVSETEQIAELLSAKGRPLVQMVFDDEGAEITRRTNLLQGYGAIVEFLETHLLR